jgi:hypothetical protein
MKDVLDPIQGTGSRIENETVVIFNEAEDEAIVTTASPAVYRKLVGLGFPVVRRFNQHRAQFRFSRALISFRRERKLSPEQRAAAAERLRRLRGVA